MQKRKSKMAGRYGDGKGTHTTVAAEEPKELLALRLGQSSLGRQDESVINEVGTREGIGSAHCEHRLGKEPADEARQSIE